MRAAEIDPTRNGYHGHFDGRDDLGGPYVLALLDSAGKALWATTIHVEDAPPINPDDPPPEPEIGFVERIPGIPEGARLAVFSPDGLIGDIGPSNSPPLLAVLDVSDGESMEIDLDVSDPDDDTVWTAAMYRPDPSSPWTAVSALRVAERIVLDSTADLPASDAGELKVIATDGWHTVEAMVHDIQIPEHAPLATIIQPATGAAFAAGRPVYLEAQAIDAEDGMLEGAAFSWTSDRDGPLGAGPGLTLYDLSEGTHLITVTAADSSGRSGQDSISIVIGPTNLPSAEIASAVAAAFDGSGGGSSWPIVVIVVVVLGGAALGLGLWSRVRNQENFQV